MNPEKTLYEQLYQQQAVDDFAAGYGHNNHGKLFTPRLIDFNPRSVLDCGCGHNEFALSLRDHGIHAVGVDFACKSADVVADLLALPFKDKEFEWVTSFDCLEHLLPGQVQPALAEMRRVSTRFAFSISHADSWYRFNGRTLHPTVRTREWWLAEIRQHATCEIEDKFFVGEWIKINS